MRFEVTIEQTITIPMVVEARSKAEALEVAERHLQGDQSETPEAVGDPVTEPPRIRSARKLGD